MTRLNVAITYTWDSQCEKGPRAYYIKLNKNELLLNRYNFSMVNAMNVQFSPLHTTPFLYRKTYFGLLNYLLAIVAWSDTPRGSKPPYL